MAGSASAAEAFQNKMDGVQAFVMHHMTDGHAFPVGPFSIPLPGFLSVHGVMLLLGVLVVLALVARRRVNPAEAPRGFTNFLEAFVLFVRDEIAVRHLGEEDGRRMTPLFCSFFFFILVMNLLGLLPFLFAATANVSVTGALAAISFALMVGGAIIRHGPVGFIRGFVPHGVPWPIALLIVPIEIAGVFIKSFALAIRLFANMLAGHMVIFFMVGLVLLFGLVGVPFLAMAVLVYLMEVFVCVLQAFIFTMLSAVFIGQCYHPSH